VARSHTMNPADRNTRQSGVPQGTPGGQTKMAASRVMGGKLSSSSPVFYLWLLVGIEVVLMGWLRHSFRRYHGG